MYFNMKIQLIDVQISRPPNALHQPLAGYYGNRALAELILICRLVSHTNYPNVQITLLDVPPSAYKTTSNCNISLDLRAPLQVGCTQLLGGPVVRTGHMGNTLFRAHRLHISPEFRVAGFYFDMSDRYSFNHIPYSVIPFKESADQ